MIKKIPFFLFLASILFNSAKAEEPVSQTHESITEAVKDFLARHNNLAGEFEISVMPVDSRLNLPQCPEALEAFSPIEVIKAGRVTIGVRCNNPAKKWSIFTSALIKTFQNVVVLSQPVPRGTIITRAQLAIERRETSNLREDFVTEPEQLENKQLIHQLNVGTILSLRNVVEPKLVKRGDAVVISTSKAGFSIKMSGVAMMDGAKGQSIKVKKQNSGRIINAIVVEAGLVTVNY